MHAPAIPYLEIPKLPLIPAERFGAGLPPIDVAIQPFGVLVAAAVYVGSWLAIVQTRRTGLDDARMTAFIAWVVGTGFVLGHVLDTVFYYPERVVEDPVSLLRLWDGLSSFGGFVGAAVGCLAFRLRHRIAVLPYADAVASAFPMAWVLGRAGCAVAHDHPGRPSELWLAVAYPEGGRFDLGLYEMVLTVPLALAFLLLRRRPRPPGFFLATQLVAYAPVRFALDFLRSDEVIVRGAQVLLPDPRYGGLTPAQWGCLLMLGAGAAGLWWALSRHERRAATSP